MKFCEVFGSARYVRAADDYQFPYIRKSFGVEKPVVRAELTVSVLGFCELYVNGKKLTDDLYVFPYTQYNRQTPADVGGSTNDPFFKDEIRYSILYSRFDVTELISLGKNAVGVIVSGGWYRTGKDKHGGFRNYGDTKACFRLSIEYADGSVEEVVSDGDCRFEESFLLAGGIFHEEQDERKEIVDFSEGEYDDSAWKSVCVVETPEAEFRLNECPPNKIVRYVTPTLLKRTDEYAVYDAGENITGFPVLRTEGTSAGDTVYCTYSELLDEGDELNVFHGYDQNTSFISDGRAEHRLRFTWHGFRYFKVWATNGEVSCEKCAVVHADVKNTSRFESDNEILNWIYAAYVRTQLENYQCGMPTDCPQIERKGYTGDGQLLADVGMMLFDSKKLYRKWLQDISDCQDRKTGFVHYTAPCFVGCGGGPGGWSVAIVIVPYAYYKAYGDESVLRDFYPQMQNYLRFMRDSSLEGLVEKKREGWCLGDWESPRGRDGLLPPPFVNTCFYIDALEKMIEIAKILGENADIGGYEAEIERLTESVNKSFFDPKTGDYCGNDQGANAIALKAGLGDRRTAENLAARYDELGEFDTGIFATKYLIETLMKYGYQEVAYKMLTSEKQCSFAAWKKQGATTLYESWINARSYNHPMFGSVVQYFFNDLLGIRQAEGSCAYRKVEIKPLKVEALKRVSGALQTAAGEVSVAIDRSGDSAKFIVVVPEGVEAEFAYEGFEKKLCAGVNKIEVNKKGV